MRLRSTIVSSVLLTSLVGGVVALTAANCPRRGGHLHAAGLSLRGVNGVVVLSAV